MTWLGFVPLVAATIGLLLVPGVIVALCAGLPARIALPIAPGVSTAIIVVAAIAADAVGMGWNLWPVARGNHHDCLCGRLLVDASNSESCC